MYILHMHVHMYVYITHVYSKMDRCKINVAAYVYMYFSSTILLITLKEGAIVTV